MRRRPSGPRTRPQRHAICAGTLLAGLMLGGSLARTALHAAEPGADRPFRLGFSPALMPEVTENDARAALKVWIETVLNRGDLRANPEVLFCDDVPTMAHAINADLVDGMAASARDFYGLREQARFNHLLFGVVAGSIFSEYVVLVHRQSGIERLEALQGHSLTILNGGRTSLAVPWLDVALMESGRPPARDFFASLSKETKLTKAVLPVFFRKTDACLVTRKGFETMGELNPQVSQQLRVLATSPRIVPAGFFFCDHDAPARSQARYVAEFKNVHTSTAGLQVLTIFQCERLEEHPASVMDSAVALLEKHRELSEPTNGARLTAPAARSNDGREAAK